MDAEHEVKTIEHAEDLRTNHDKTRQFDDNASKAHSKSMKNHCSETMKSRMKSHKDSKKEMRDVCKSLHVWKFGSLRDVFFSTFTAFLAPPVLGNGSDPRGRRKKSQSNLRPEPILLSIARFR